nr:immunoglobulin heavy chain junction region [Macaca mulatta]
CATSPVGWPDGFDIW